MNETIGVEHDLRVCDVNGRIGYFHTWEHFSQPIAGSITIGGAPPGVVSYVVGIVEFENGVERVHPESIKFCDKKNSRLHILGQRKEEVMV